MSYKVEWEPSMRQGQGELKGQSRCGNLPGRPQHSGISQPFSRQWTAAVLCMKGYHGRYSQADAPHSSCGQESKADGVPRNSRPQGTSWPQKQLPARLLKWSLTKKVWEMGMLSLEKGQQDCCQLLEKVCHIFSCTVSSTVSQHHSIAQQMFVWISTRMNERHTEGTHTL